MTFTSSDLKQLEARGISIEQAEAQLQSFKTGFPALDIVAPAAKGKINSLPLANAEFIPINQSLGIDLDVDKIGYINITNYHVSP